MGKDLCRRACTTLRETAHAMEDRRNHPDPAPSVQTEAERIQPGGNTGRRTRQYVQPARQVRRALPDQKDSAAKRPRKAGALFKPSWGIRRVRTMETVQKCAFSRRYLYDRSDCGTGGESAENSRRPKCLLFNCKHWTRYLSICYTKT